MLEKKMLLIIMLLIVVVLAGCASSPRRTVSPVVTTPAPAPHIEVEPPAPPFNNGSENKKERQPDRPYLGGGFKLSEEQFEPDKPLGGKIDSRNVQLRPEKQIAAAPHLPPAPQQPHVHDIYPVFGQVWTHECRTCPANIGLSTPTTYQSPAPPQIYSQSEPQLPQQSLQYPQNAYPGSGVKMLDRGTVRNEKRTSKRERKVIAEQLPNGMSRTDISVYEETVKGGYWTETGPAGLR